jgi:hypothetical protein
MRRHKIAPSSVKELLSLFCIVCMLPLAACASAQQGAPRANKAPQPGDCTVEPLALPLFGGTPPSALLVATPKITNTVTPQVGEPADAATVEAITATVRMSLACANGGDVLRQFALFSDRYLRALFTGPDAAYMPAFEQKALNPRQPLPDDWLSLITVGEVEVLPDERARARVVTSSGGNRYEDVLIFVEVDGAWRIDAAILLSPRPGTPAP